MVSARLLFQDGAGNCKKDYYGDEVANRLLGVDFVGGEMTVNHTAIMISPASY